jgi:hypothetical protein
MPDGKIKVAHEHDTKLLFRIVLCWKKRFACLAIVNCELKELKG